MVVPGFKGILLVVRHASTQTEIVFQHPLFPLSNICNLNSENKWPLLNKDYHSSDSFYFKGKRYRELASLLLPSDAIFSKGFEISFDTPSTDQHIKFVCLPWTVTNNHQEFHHIPYNNEKYIPSETLKDSYIKYNSHSCDIATSRDKVEQFCLVMIFDPRENINLEIFSKFSEIISRGLDTSESIFGYLSFEVLQINKLVNDIINRDEAKEIYSNETFENQIDSNDSKRSHFTYQELHQSLIDTSPLCQNLFNFYEMIQNFGQATLFIDDWFSCNLFTPFRKVPKTTLESQMILIQNFDPTSKYPQDSGALIRNLSLAAKSHTKISNLITDLETPFETTAKAANHFSYWGYSHISDKLEDDHIFSLDSTRNLNDIYELSTEFKITFPTCCASLIVILTFFAQKISIKTLKTNLNQFSSQTLITDNPNTDYPFSDGHSNLFDSIVKWLLSKRFIRRVKLYLHFTPNFVQILKTPADLTSINFLKFESINEEEYDKWINSNYHSIVNPPYFLISDLIAQNFVTALRLAIKPHLNLGEISDQYLLNLYLILKEQLYLSKVPPDLSKHYLDDKSFTLDNPLYKQLIWKSNQELELDLISDNLELTYNFPYSFLEAIIFFLALLNNIEDSHPKSMLRNSPIHTSNQQLIKSAFPSDANSLIVAQVSDNYVNNIHFKEFIMNKKQGILSDALFLAYI